MISKETLPRKAAPLTATIQPLEQEGVNRPFKAVKRTTVIGHPKVVEMSAQFPPDCLPYSSFQVISTLLLSYGEENDQPSRMPVAYSTDLRTRVIDAWNAKEGTQAQNTA